MLDCFNDEFVVAGDVEEGTTSPRAAEFNQRLAAEGVLGRGEKKATSSEIPGLAQQKSTTDVILF